MQTNFSTMTKAQLTRYARETHGMVLDRVLRREDMIDILAMEEGSYAAEPEPYSRDWEIAQVDKWASELRSTIAEWFEFDRDDNRQMFRLYGRMLVASRAMAGYAPHGRHD